MALFARSDVVSVIIPPANGGCGRVHSRPVNGGAPVPIWEFDHEACPPCAAALAKHDHWSGTISEIPETPDEKVKREDLDKRGAADQVKATAAVLEKIGALPENLAAALLALANGSLAVPALPAATVECPNGHPNPADAKFCAECGGHIGMPPAGEAAGAGPITPEPDAEPDPLPDLSGLKLAELRKLATDRGLDQSGTKAEITARLTAA